MFVTSHVLLQLLAGTLYHMSYIDCAVLLPFGNNSTWIEDEELYTHKLSTPLKFFDKKYNELYVSDDGVIAFNKDMKGKTNKPKSFPYEEKVIAPLWHDFDGAKVYFRTITPGTSPNDLKTASNLVKKTHPNREHFEAEWAVVFTWYNVSLYHKTEEKNNTFQSLLVANENATFVIFLYGELQDAGEAQIGVNAGHCKIYYSLCISLTEKTTNMMDMRTCDGDYGVVGFRIDSADRDQAFYRCSPTYMYREERALQCECSSLDLPSSEIIAENNSTRVGGVLSYSCIEGYALIGDDELACYYNGSRAIWDGYEFGCIKLPQWVSPNQDDEYASVTVLETARSNQLVFKLQALTGDGTANISYSFVKQIPTNPNLFDLFEDEVRVMPNADLDVDEKWSRTIYVLQFRAKDTRFSFTDRISRDAYLIVNIKDMNDNVPKFTKSLYTKRIEGSKEKGSYVLGVTALDKDASCPNNEVHYQIVDESLPGYFSLNPFDGKIRLVKQLNSTQYSMSVKATDGGYTGGYDAARVTIYVDNLVTTSTTTTKPVPEPVAMTTPASTGLSTAGVVGIIVAIGILMIVGILVFFYRRHLLMNQPSVSASFKHGKANVVLDNPNFIPNSSYIDDHSFSQPVPASSTNTTESATDYDSHCDTQVLTTDSWRKEKERVKMQSGQRKIDQ